MTHLEKQSRALQRHLSVALAKLELDVPAKAVHRLRATSRRIQALISLQNAKLRGKDRDTVRELEKIRKRAGKVRDLDVQLGLLRVLANRSAERDRQSLRQALLKKRARKSERLASAARDIVQSKFSGHLYSALQQVVTSIDSRGNGVESPLTEAHRRQRQLAAEFSAEPQLSSKQLHRLRIQLKRVRYLAELAQPSVARDEFIERLKSVQTVLGEWRDWELLARTAEKQFTDHTNCALLAEIRARLASKHALVVPALTRLLCDSPERKQPQRAAFRRALAQHA